MATNGGIGSSSGDPTEVRGSLGEVMGRTARRLREEKGDVEATLQAITDSAIAIVPNVEHASISFVIGRRKVEPRAWTSELPKTIDSIQERLGQGPCLDAVWDEEVVHVDHVATDRRWPQFAEQASREGVGSMLSFQLFVTGDRLGGLNLYGSRPHAFDDESQEMGHLLAAHAGVALAAAMQEEHLRIGMGSRDLIGQAKGILMERYRLTADQAFALLSRVSQETNRKLVDIAAELTETGAVPAPAPRRA